MTSFNVKAMLDPVRTSREEGRLQGRKEMRDSIRDQFVTFAMTHPDPTVRDELWAFKEHIEKASLS